MKRYPLGLRSWVFWVLAGFVGVAISQIPVVGIPIALVGLAAVGFWYGVTVKPERDRRFADYAPVPVTGEERMMFDRLEVVGESHYITAISRAVALSGRELDAVLAWEPRNPHSNGGTAIRVDLLVGGDRITCGHIPSGISSDVLPFVRDAAGRGKLPVIEATVFGGTATKQNYGVLLGTGPRKPARGR
ncbi:hypothetical protein [Microbacterium nymphoidis]|uniref:hypothetical protein n=1 Tax=Microbacterium nymphoidis TaxID=2898586 RepID=UPI001E47E630|nr:hypothetical protein [Microbacterium nymphoidis]MCD2499322.1 hypothetical protein [Microbacterium nymphoidis]